MERSECAGEGKLELEWPPGVRWPWGGSSTVIGAMPPVLPTLLRPTPPRGGVFLPGVKLPLLPGVSWPVALRGDLSVGVCIPPCGAIVLPQPSEP